MDSRILATARCTSLSSTVGIPKGRVLPLPFGISTRLTGGALYFFSFILFHISFTLSSILYSNSLVVSPSTPLVPFLFIIFHVSFRNSGVIMWARDVNTAFLSLLALIAISSNFVDIFIYLCLCSLCFLVENSFCPVASPCTWLSHARSTINRSDSRHSFRLLVDGPFGLRTLHLQRP